MAKRYRGPAGATATTSEFILAKQQLEQDIGDYMARCAALDPPPHEFIEALLKYQQEVGTCRPDELPTYREHFDRVKQS